MRHGKYAILSNNIKRMKIFYGKKENLSLKEHIHAYFLNKSF